MPKIPDVVDGEVIESSWGNQSIRDRTVQRMDTVADRDASIPAPGQGETVWIEDLATMQTWTGSVWLNINKEGTFTAIPWAGFGGGAITAPANTYQEVLAITIPTAGLWVVTSSGFISSSTTARPVFTTAILVGSGGTELAFQQLSATADAVYLPYSTNGVATFSAGQTAVAAVKSNDSSGTQRIEQLHMWAQQIS